VKIYGKKNVFDAALDRIRFLFDEFPNVICNVSGGKDSTVVYNLTLQVAKEKNRLPLKVMFVDQEAEWEATIEQVRLIMENPDVEPIWVQMPIRLFNATSKTEHWLYCWDEKEKDRWMREKELYSIKENHYGVDRFTKVFDAFLAVDYPKTKSCYITGVRAEESPSRSVGLTTSSTYKWITWGRIVNKSRQHFNFHPIYDWSYMDVWAAIHKNGWHYNSIYDAQHIYGLPIKDMRVSNVHHETSVHSLFYMQEVEPETYVKLTQRIAGIDMAGKLGTSDYFVKDLPYMFASWQEYRDFLLEKLIESEEWKAGFRKGFARQEALYGETEVATAMRKVQISSILTQDWEQIKMGNFETRPSIYNIRRREQGRTFIEGKKG